MHAVAREEFYPIRTVASLTGVNPVTLRAWERRYALVSPRRAPSGHRLYSRADLELLRRVVALMEQGIPFARARALAADEDASAPANAGPAASGRETWDRTIVRMLDAVTRFDEADLEAAYNDALSLYPIELVHEHAVVPLLLVLGERWSRRRGGIAEEHFFSNYLRNKLGARLHHLAASARAPTLVMACMPDDRHDLGLLMFAHRAGAHGYRVVMLGAALPLEELVPAVRQAAAHALVLSMAVSPAPRLLDAGLAELVREVRVPVLVGGARSHVHAAAIEASGATVLGSSVDAALALIDALPRGAGSGPR